MFIVCVYRSQNLFLKEKKKKCCFNSRVYVNNDDAQSNINILLISSLFCYNNFI